MKKMKKIHYLLIGILVISACTDLEDEFYDRIPADKYPENETQAALLTVPIYAPMRLFLDDQSGWWYCQEVTTDELVFPTRHTDWDDGGKWRALHEHNWTNTTAAISAMWNPFYDGIGEANQLLESMNEESTDPAIQETIAKVKIMRSYYYYLLIDNYGDVPYVTSFSEAPEHPSKTDRATIFSNIINEIESNIPNLGSSSSKTEVTRGMAFSVLAKLYLNAQVYAGTPQWAKAEEACDSIIALGTYSLESNPLGPFITENSSSPENIFTIPYDEDSYKGFNLHMRTLHYVHNQKFDMTSGPWNGCAVMYDFYNTYEDDDIRKTNGFLVGLQYSSSGEPLLDAAAGSELILNPYIPALFMNATYTPQEIRMSGARIVKFEIKMGATDNLSNDFPIFRYADILLMKAESMIRQGKSVTDALEFVNPIRTRAGIEAWNAEDLTLDSLLAERGREMFFEAHRRQDLIRFGKYLEAWWEKDASTSDRLTFPIPQKVIDSNPNLEN